MGKKRIEIRAIPGIVSGRIGAGFLTGMGLLSTAALDFASTPVLELGVTGLFLGGAGMIVAKSIDKVKQSAKIIARNELGGANVELETKDVTKVFFGIPSKEKRIYVNKGGLAKTSGHRTPAVLSRFIPGSTAFVADLPESQTFEEINNYIVLKNGKAYVEKIITPTSLRVWDEAFQQSGGTVTWETAKPVRTAEESFRNLFDVIYKPL